MWQLVAAATMQPRAAPATTKIHKCTNNAEGVQLSQPVFTICKQVVAPQSTNQPATHLALPLNIEPAAAYEY